jgi:hypothetical protein
MGLRGLLTGIALPYFFLSFTFIKPPQTEICDSGYNIDRQAALRGVPMFQSRLQYDTLPKTKVRH